MGSSNDVQMLMFHQHRSILFLFLSFFAAGSFFYSGFTADDAYITARYARNFVSGHGLVYNIGEHVSALTSPLHVFVLAALSMVSSNMLAAYKIVAASLVAVTISLASRQFKVPTSCYGFLLLTLLSPFIIMWTQGGLETPLLVACFTTIAWLTLEGRRPHLVLCLSAIAMIIRYDAVLFVGPVVGYLVFVRKTSLIGLLFFAIPAAWLVCAHYYFGDIFPTSFYLKTPGGSLSELTFSVLYELEWFFFSGLMIPITVFFLQRKSLRLPELSAAEIAVALGAGIMLLYGFAAGIKHMMFGYRLFLPILPAAAMLLLRHTSMHMPHIVAMGVLQVVLFFVVLLVGVNPSFGPYYAGQRYSYQLLSLREYATVFLPTMDANGVAIQNHWETLGKNRTVRIHTYAGGKMPYAFPDTYIFEGLVSYRKHCKSNWKNSADYITIFTPRMGTSKEQLEGVNAKLIDSRPIMINNTLQTFEVWFNPNPSEKMPSTNINDPC